MSGYISLCAGDPCPPIFRSPVAGMEDIMDNQVICAVYRLPDAHKHITRPPSGVIFPKKTVTLGDIKPEPVLWHEDSGKKPWENGRHNPPGMSSGRQLGPAAHRFVANSLRSNADRNSNGGQMYAPPPSYAGTRGPPFPSYQSNSYHDQEQNRMVRPRSGYPAQSSKGHPGPSNSYTVRNQFDNTYGHPRTSPVAQSPFNRSHPWNERSNQFTTESREYPAAHGYYPPGLHQDGHSYTLNEGPSQHLVQAPIPSGTHFREPSGYNGYGGYQSYGDASYHQRGGSWTPRGNQSSGRGYTHPQQQSGNQFSALNRGASRRPPPRGYSR